MCPTAYTDQYVWYGVQLDLSDTFWIFWCQIGGEEGERIKLCGTNLCGL